MEGFRLPQVFCTVRLGELYIWTEVNMTGLYIFRQDHTPAELRSMARGEKGYIAQRFLMIANLLEGMDPESAARGAGMGRTSAYKWHNIYEEEGVEGLRKSGHKGRPPRVNDEVAQAIKERILRGADVERDGIISFRGLDIQEILKEDYNMDLSLSAVYELLHRLGLSWLMPRPQHPESDTQAQEHFRKLFICN